jgi:hypothetical protein
MWRIKKTNDNGERNKVTETDGGADSVVRIDADVMLIIATRHSVRHSPQND